MYKVVRIPIDKKRESVVVRTGLSRIDARLMAQTRSMYNTDNIYRVKDQSTGRKVCEYKEGMEIHR